MEELRVWTRVNKPDMKLRTVRNNGRRDTVSVRITESVKLIIGVHRETYKARDICYEIKFPNGNLSRFDHPCTLFECIEHFSSRYNKVSWNRVDHDGELCLYRTDAKEHMDKDKYGVLSCDVFYGAQGLWSDWGGGDEYRTQIFYKIVRPRGHQLSIDEMFKAGESVKMSRKEAVLDVKGLIESGKYTTRTPM